jgi:hypothetical protein
MRRCVILAALLAPTIAVAAEIGGTWQGEYSCNQGRTGLTLTVIPSEAGAARAIFRFYEINSNPGVPSGCFTMSGTVSGNQLRLHAEKWLFRPLGYVTVDLAGTVNPAGASLTGSIFGPNCTTFSLVRVFGDPNPEICRPLGAPVS